MSGGPISVVQAMQELVEPGGFEEIQAFVSVAELGSFAAAATRIGRDASVVSRRVSLLERRLGVRLLTRTTRRVSLTDAGAAYLKRVQAVLVELAAANQEASEEAATLRGALRVSFPTTFGRMWLAPLLPAFLAEHPLLRIEASFSDRFVDLVAEGFDIAVRIGVLRDSSLVSRRIAGHRKLLCAAPPYLAARGTPKSPTDLARHACLGFTGHSSWPQWLLQKGTKRMSVRPAGPLVTDNADVALVAAIEGAGIVLTADWLAGPALRDGRLVEVLPGWTARGNGGVYAVLPPGKLVPAKSRAFVDYFASALRSIPDWSSAPRIG